MHVFYFSTFSVSSPSRPLEMVEQKQRIVVVDDEQQIRIALFEMLSAQGYDVSVAEDGRMALEIIKRNVPDLVITDIRMPEMGGLDLLHRIKAQFSALPVVIMTAYATVDTAVLAIKQGAFDYILKPFSDEMIMETVIRVFRQTAQQAEPVRVISRKKKNRGKNKPIIGRDEKVLRLMKKARSVASSKATVLLLGESGTGKEVFARYLHNESDRRNSPFVALNCAALPEGLLESELFGHEKGAFTGAISTKKGKFELANGGTLLLDEISEIPLHLQAKLLRVLQEEEVDRLGARGPVEIDVHVLATSNRDLEKTVEEGNFRQDLYYRLNVIPLRLPALRERRQDIPLLTDYFVEKFSTQYDKNIKKLSSGSKQRFMNYSWPGNVREMENLVERAVLLSASDELEVWDFWDDDSRVPGSLVDDFVERPDSVENSREDSERNKDGRHGTVSAESIMPLKDVERQMILQALQKTDDNRTHAAKMLGISVRTLRNKLHEYRTSGFIS